jgi:IS1 family transposase
MDKIIFIVKLAVIGNGVRTLKKEFGIDPETTQAVLLAVGLACSVLHDQRVRGLGIDYVQMDELWSFIGLKDKTLKRLGLHPRRGHTRGSVWTFMAVHPLSMLIVAYLEGRRSYPFVLQFIEDLHSRLTRRITLASDGYERYVHAVRRFFGPGNVDYGMIKKTRTKKGRYVRSEKVIVFGHPSLKLIKTTSIENRNLHFRMRTRRMQRRTNGHSKAILNHFAALALWACHHNFCHKPERLKGATPAMVAGIADEPWSVGRLIMEAFTALIVSRNRP